MGSAQAKRVKYPNLPLHPFPCITSLPSPPPPYRDTLQHQDCPQVSLPNSHPPYNTSPPLTVVTKPAPASSTTLGSGFTHFSLPETGHRLPNMSPNRRRLDPSPPIVYHRRQPQHPQWSWMLSKHVRSFTNHVTSPPNKFWTLPAGCWPDLNTSVTTSGASDGSALHGVYAAASHRRRGCQL